MTWSERFTAAGVLSLALAFALLVVSVERGVGARDLVLALVVLWIPLLGIAFTIIGLALLGSAADRAGRAPGSAHGATMGPIAPNPEVIARYPAPPRPYP